MAKAPRQCNGHVIALLKWVKSPASRAPSLWASVEEKSILGLLASSPVFGKLQRFWRGKGKLRTSSLYQPTRGSGEDDSCHLAASPATCCRETFQCASPSLYIASTRGEQDAGSWIYSPLYSDWHLRLCPVYSYAMPERKCANVGGGVYFVPLHKCSISFPSRIQKRWETVSGAMYILYLSLSRGLVDIIVQFISELSSLVSVRQESA